MQTNGTRLACNECGAMVEGYGASTCTAKATAKWNARVGQGWVSCADRLPPVGVYVLVTDGEDIKIDRIYLHREINGRVLLPSDPRNDTTPPDQRFAIYHNVTHWMPLPSVPRQAPNAKTSGPTADTASTPGVGGSAASPC
jgi:hypothetical protein